MIQTATIREHKRKPMNTETREKLDRCYQESLDLTERELRCPYCNRYLATLYSDTAGHFKTVCKNCKSTIIFNLGYFRRARRYGRYRDR